jgi:hypothetical protein
MDARASAEKGSAQGARPAGDGDIKKRSPGRKVLVLERT